MSGAEVVAAETVKAVRVVTDSADEWTSGGEQMTTEDFGKWVTELIGKDRVTEDCVQTQNARCCRLTQGGSSLRMKQSKSLPLLLTDASPVAEESRRSRAVWCKDKALDTTLRRSSKRLKDLIYMSKRQGPLEEASKDPVYIRAEERDEFLDVSEKAFPYTGLIAMMSKKRVAHHLSRRGILLPLTLIIGVNKYSFGGTPRAVLMELSPDSYSYQALEDINEKECADAFVRKHQLHSEGLPLAICKWEASGRAETQFLYSHPEIEQKILAAKHTPAAIFYFQRFIRSKGMKPWMLKYISKDPAGPASLYMLTSTSCFPSSKEECAPSTMHGRQSLELVRIDHSEARPKDYQVAAVDSNASRCFILKIPSDSFLGASASAMCLMRALRKLLGVTLCSFVVDVICDAEERYWVSAIRSCTLSRAKMTLKEETREGRIINVLQQPVQKQKQAFCKPCFEQPASKGLKCVGVGCKKVLDPTVLETICSLSFRLILQKRVCDAQQSLTLSNEEIINAASAQELKRQFAEVHVCPGCFEHYITFQKRRQEALRKRSTRLASSNSSRSAAACHRLYGRFLKKKENETTRTAALLLQPLRVKRRASAGVRSKKKATQRKYLLGDQVLVVDSNAAHGMSHNNSGTIVEVVRDPSTDSSRVLFSVLLSDGSLVDGLHSEQLLSCRGVLEEVEIVGESCGPPGGMGSVVSTADAGRYNVLCQALESLDQECSSLDSLCSLVSLPSAEESIESECDGDVAWPCKCPFGCGAVLSPVGVSLSSLHTSWQKHLSECVVYNK